MQKSHTARHQQSAHSQQPSNQSSNIMALTSAISSKMSSAWDELTAKIASAELDQNHQQDKPKVASKPQDNGLRIKVRVSKQKEEKGNSIEGQHKREPNTVTPKGNPLVNFRTRTKSQNNTHLKSLKKDNQLPDFREQEEKKALRLKEITKRKLELMDKLKKIDAELLEAKKQVSTQKMKQGKSFLSITNKNQSFANVLANSRNSRSQNQNLQQHAKAFQMLQKLNIQKLKRQERMVEEMKKKQEAELARVKQLERQKSLQRQERNKRKQGNLKLNKYARPKFNQMKNIQNESLVMPMTMVAKNNERKSMNEDQFLDGTGKPDRKHLFTQRDGDAADNNTEKPNEGLKQQLKQGTIESAHQDNANLGDFDREIKQNFRSLQQIEVNPTPN